MINIPIGLDEEIVAKVDALVKKGVYKNRSEALRAQIIKGLAQLSIFENNFIGSEEYNLILEKLLALPRPPNLLPTSKTITELVSEGRSR